MSVGLMKVVTSYLRLVGSIDFNAFFLFFLGLFLRAFLNFVQLISLHNRVSFLFILKKTKIIVLSSSLPWRVQHIPIIIPAAYNCQLSAQ